VIVAEVEAATAVVVTLNVMLVAPAATVTLAGTVAAVGLVFDRVTTAPPVGAGPFKVTVPVEELPPNTLAGFMAKADTAGGLMVIRAVSVDPL
jgi:hypothetical protein